MFTTASRHDVQNSSGMKERVSRRMVARVRSRWSKVSLTLLSISTGLSVKNTLPPSAPISTAGVRLPPVTMCTVTVSDAWVRNSPWKYMGVKF